MNDLPSAPDPVDDESAGRDPDHPDVPADGPTDEPPAVSPDGDGSADGASDDDPVAAPVIGCLRCGAQLTLGSRYCPSCGVPQVRSGEQAATALSRTRRNAPRAVRIGVPLAVAVVAVVALLVASHDPTAQARRDVEAHLRATVDANRGLSKVLVGLKPGAPAAPALESARSSARSVEAASAALRRLDGAPQADARTSRATEAVATVDDYVSTVVVTLADPRSKQLDAIGRRSRLAEAAFKSVDDLVDGLPAIDGTRELAAYTRARRRAPSAKPRSGSSASTSKAKKAKKAKTTPVSSARR